MPKVYLDFASTTPIDPKVMRTMRPYFKKDFGNPSSIHSFGQKAIAAIDDARQKVAGFLGCELDEVIFTGHKSNAKDMSVCAELKKLKPDIFANGGDRFSDNTLEVAVCGTIN